MANQHKGEFEFDVAGVTYQMRWTTNAMCVLETQARRSVTSVVTEMASWGPPTDDKGERLPETDEQIAARVDRIRLTPVRDVFWAMLRDCQRDITIDRAGEIMDSVGGLAPTLELINHAWQRASSPETKGARPQSAAEADGTGQPS